VSDDHRHEHDGDRDHPIAKRDWRDLTGVLVISGRRDSNPLPRAWEARALPGELRPLGGQILRSWRRVSLSTLPRVSARAFVVVIAVLAVIALLGFGLIAKEGESLAVGEPAPETALPRLDGEGTASIADHRGEWVLVNFWASWCTPCNDESPALQNFYERNRGRGLVVLGIATRDLTYDALAFVRALDLTYPQVRDPDADSPLAEEEFGATGLPESYLINPRGKLALIRRGPVDEEYLDRFVEPMIR
jgi:cytochrome c biogenesis protein CcmG, thiol:disulfide interchange protein DsbE